jgi:hypothetical protein
MSHITTLSKANIVDPIAFASAMRELGYTKIVQNGTIKAYDGRTLHADVVVSNGRYSIGLVKAANGKYDLTGDFQCFGWELTQKMKTALRGKMSDKDIADCVLRYTTKHTIGRRAAAMGYKCQAIENKDGQIQIQLIQ